MFLVHEMGAKDEVTESDVYKNWNKQEAQEARAREVFLGSWVV